jgi:hypothetical protein
MVFACLPCLLLLPLRQLQKAVDLVFQTMPHQVNILGNFMDNHDMPRMASYAAVNKDIILWVHSSLKSAAFAF